VVVVRVVTGLAKGDSGGRARSVNDNQGSWTIRWLTRKKRIEPVTGFPSWPRASQPRHGACRVEEYETAKRARPTTPSAANSQALGIVEAKKLTLGPQNVLTQAERYARGATGNAFEFDAFHVPFLYSTNGEVFWFHDIRHSPQPLTEGRPLSHARRPARNARARLRGRLPRPQTLPEQRPRLRPYQIDANAATGAGHLRPQAGDAPGDGDGTGKTFTLVNQVYRLMKTASRGGYCSW